MGLIPQYTLYTGEEKEMHKGLIVFGEFYTDVNSPNAIVEILEDFKFAMVFSNLIFLENCTEISIFFRKPYKHSSQINVI